MSFLNQEIECMPREELKKIQEEKPAIEDLDAEGGDTEPTGQE